MKGRFVTKEYTTAEEIKKTRTRLGLTQKEFAALVGASKPTVERWEMSDKSIAGQIAVLLPLLTSDYVDRHRIPHRTKPLRMWYMYKDTICTLIDVDDRQQRVDIKNYVSNPQFRAFGCNDNPSYADYQDFLASRCFPETRDKMKIILDDLDLPHYDAFLIIQKTKGKMAEDDFWILIEGNDDRTI